MTKAEKHKKYMREVWYPRNKAKHVAMVAVSRRKRLVKLRAEFKQLKSNLKCVRCGENHIACLDFHHKNPKKKIDAISAMIVRGFGVRAIKKEIAKCIVLCSNCHRKEHFDAGTCSGCIQDS